MGAYYTKEDITDYISKNTILPALFDMAKRSCKIAFEGDHSVWRLLRVEPDRYIHAPLLKGLGMTLPADIEAGTGTRANAQSGIDRRAMNLRYLGDLARSPFSSQPLRRDSFEVEVGPDLLHQ